MHLRNHSYMVTSIVENALDACTLEKQGDVCNAIPTYTCLQYFKV